MGHHDSKKRRHDEGSHSKKSKKKHRKVEEDEEEMWEESNVDTAASSSTPAGPSKSVEPRPESVSSLRDAWMLDPTAQTASSGGDFFASMGIDHKKKQDNKPDPNAPPPVSSKELNQEIRTGQSIESQPARPSTPGGPGSQWRMMRLRRVFETAEEEGRPIEQVAIERFGSLDAFEEAKEERRILDERDGRRKGAGPSSRSSNRDGETRFMFNDTPGGSRSSSFRRPNGPGTPNPPSNPRLNSIRNTSIPSPLSRTPVPSVMTPPIQGHTPPTRSLSPSSLNKLQAKVLRAKLMGDPNADALEREYDAECAKAANQVASPRVEVLPTLDARGRLYDVGNGAKDEAPQPGNRKRKEKVETRDPKTGEIVRYNADDDTTTLSDMIRHERFGGGAADQKNLDAQFAQAIMGDGKFENDLDYIDDNAEKLGRQKMRSDAMKRQFAIHDYARTQKALTTCQFCYGEDDSPPKAPVVAMGTRAFLSCTLREELVPGHCLIVPIQHHLSMLEADDDVWDEVRNFMKCLMKMFAEEDKGVIFYETVLTLKWQKHTVIECVPLPWSLYEDIPGYFKESILQSELEWSQHKKLIDFSSRPGGFRRAMVPNLPYFMVQFDHKGERGYGHVIEGTGNAAEEDENGMDEGEKGGGEFPQYFAGEIIGNVLDLEPRKWLKPRWVDQTRKRERVSQFKGKYGKFDWTGMIER